MKRIISIFILVVAATTLVSAQTVKKGPVVDKVYIDVRMSQEIGLKDAAEGKTDIFYESVTGPTFSALPADTKAKLEAYSVPLLTYSLLMNPIPNKAPYTLKVGEKTLFNPLAITEVRFALNFLISRKQIVDEILGGNGQPMFTHGEPGPARHLPVQPHRLEVRLHRCRQREEGDRGHQQRHRRGRGTVRAEGQAGEGQGVLGVQRRAGHPPVLHPGRRPQHAPEGRPLHRRPDPEGRPEGRARRGRPGQVQQRRRTTTTPRSSSGACTPRRGAPAAPGPGGTTSSARCTPGGAATCPAATTPSSGTTTTRRSTTCRRRRRTASTSPRTSTGKPR